MIACPFCQKHNLPGVKERALHIIAHHTKLAMRPGVKARYLSEVRLGVLA